MQIKTFHSKLKEQGIPITIEALTKYLADLGLEDVPQGMVNDLTADLKKNYVTALELANQGKVELKTDAPAQPPAQAPQQQHPPQAIDLETQQAIANSVNGLQAQVVNYVGQQETQLAEIRNMLGDYNRGLGLRLWNGVAQDLKAQGSYNINIDQAMQNSWGNVKADLQSKIDQVNAAAGVKDAA